MKPIIVTTSCGSREEAENIARRVLEARLVACAQIMVTQSMYWWKDTLESENEYVITMKSKRVFFDKLVIEIKKIHSYDVPEIIATEIIAVDQPYRDWLASELAGC